MDTSLQNITDVFKLPICYNNNRKLSKTIIDDLELNETYDTSANSINSFFYNLNSGNKLSSVVSKEMTKYYTTDLHFLKDMQKILKTYKWNQQDNKDTNYSEILSVWNEIKNNISFKEKYHYVEWKSLEFLNNSEYFLEFISIYNLLSPVISFITPLIIVIVPFFIIQIKGIRLSIEEYMNIFKTVVSKHSLGKLMNIHNATPKEKVYAIVSAAFYFFSIYQNVLVCMRFNDNMTKIHKYMKQITSYLEYTISSMNNYIEYAKDLSTQTQFISSLTSNVMILNELKSKISSISEYKLYNIKKIKEIGWIMKCFYELYNDKKYNDSLLYSFGFNGYVDCLLGTISNINDKYLHFCDYTTKSNKKNVFKKSYYAALKNEKHVKNNIKLNKSMILTGPNASGKTTVLKTSIINIIFSQQFGCGFYESAVFKPYDYIHCYLNIPDTSGRDSLFQAEARRCKEIIDSIDENKHANHFCAFDELYSGTNPDDAVSSSTSFMKYLIKNKNVSCLLTTHFIDVCDNLNKNKSICNYHMSTNKEKDKIKYTYQLNKGISTVKGGLNILNNMNYPKEILDNCKQTNQTKTHKK
jgi:hypothetical protein